MKLAPLGASSSREFPLEYLDLNLKKNLKTSSGAIIFGVQAILLGPAEGLHLKSLSSI